MNSTISAEQGHHESQNLRPRERVAIVHDYLNQRGGAERVVLGLAKLWPEAPIYTSLYRPASTFEEFRGLDIRTTFLDRLPIDSGFRNLFPAYPAAFRSFGPIDADIVIASSSGWAHMARTVSSAMHLVYCHTPARWLYGGAYLSSSSRVACLQGLAAPLTAAMRRLDAAAARRADGLLVNGENVRRRVGQIYGRDARVVYPPVNVGRLAPTPRGDRLLVVARLLPYKRVDLVVEAARRLGCGLDVVGDGPVLDSLRRRAGANTRFHGAVGDDHVEGLLATCSAVCVAAEEDFGIVAVEAQAAGKPVVAFGRGGACETVVDGVTGVLFEEQTVESLVAALRTCEALATSPEQFVASAARFSSEAFASSMGHAIEAARESRALEHTPALATGVA